MTFSNINPDSATATMTKHPIEANDSWDAHAERQSFPSSATDTMDEKVASLGKNGGRNLRRLHHNHQHEDANDESSEDAFSLHNNNNEVTVKSKASKKKYEDTATTGTTNNNDDLDPIQLENIKTQHDLKVERKQHEYDAHKIAKDAKKRKKRYEELYRNPGIQKKSVHGLMIDAGSTGSRMHVYEFQPRILANKFEVEAAVTGKKLSYPGIESRWTERLRPGISDFALIENDDELEATLAEYLEPLINFAKSVLHSKTEEFGNFPIFLKATAGLRTIPPAKRQRVISTVRKLFANETFCPFWDEEERVRVISGEEEAVYGWAGVNFLLGNLMENSEGSGEAHGSAIKTYGALDLGGASTQISFYQPDGDVMSGLFKLQIGQGKHWNVYAHSHLMYGMNMAENRRKARLVRNTTVRERLVDGVYDPCLPGGGKLEFKSIVHFDKDGIETWDATVDDFASSSNAVEPGSYHATLVNNQKTGNWNECKALARELLNEKSNSWCNFTHHGSCSFAGAYQPEIPAQEASFGEFYAFSNYYHVWQFLQLESRSTIQKLDDRAQKVCSQSWDQLKAYNQANTQEKYTDDELSAYCFHAAYVHEILRHGYGFQPEHHITATDVVNGQKVTWALGSILYEINTLPWDYVQVHSQKHLDHKFEKDFFSDWDHDFSWFIVLVALGSLVAFMQVFRLKRRRDQPRRSRGWKEGYEPVSDAGAIEIEPLIH